MKFLVLVLCVCAASAASTFNRQVDLKPWQVQNKVPFGRSFDVPAPVKFTRPVVTPTQFGKTIGNDVPVLRAGFEKVPVVNVFEPVVPAVSSFKKYDVAAPVVRGAFGSESDAPILRSESDVKPDGFNYVYETGNGIAAEATGDLKTVDGSNVVVTRGSYRYTAPDGTPVVVNYIADENGYQPQSDLLPVGPAIPVAIARSLEWIASQPKHVEVFRKI